MVKFRELYLVYKVIVLDIVEGDEEMMKSGFFEFLDVINYSEMEDIVICYEIIEVYLMVVMFLVMGEKFFMKVWNLNMNFLFNVFNFVKEGKIDKIFWLLSIVVFGFMIFKNDIL